MPSTEFELVTPFQPTGDQPQAIEKLVRGLRGGKTDQVLLGVTGSGKTFTVANVIAQTKLPTLVLCHNKTLAAQLFSEFKEFFPKNAVEYFVSYYDFYQPEAYIPSTDTYIEKDSQINEEIDKLRHAATRSLFERRDVIIVSSISCIYGLGSPEAYQGMLLVVDRGQQLERQQLLRQLVEIQYKRNDIDFHRGTFRVRGDVVEIFPAYEEDEAIRVELLGDEVERMVTFDPLTGQKLAELHRLTLYPASHYVTTLQARRRAIETVRVELRERLQELKRLDKGVEAQRLGQRTLYDLEMIEELGYCQGIENYSRHLTGRGPGAPPPTLLEYFPKDWLLVVDESHVTVPQIGGMYRGDRARKMNLVEHGFRLPSALDNRPLNFQEWEASKKFTIYVSATPGQYELEKSGGEIVEQIIRPTGIVDPVCEIRKAGNQVEDLLEEIRKRVALQQRVLVTTLTKRLAEDLTRFYQEQKVRVKYLHSEVETLERIEILRDLRLGTFDVLVGINLLREGLDLPEVSLVAILDADKEGFLRSARSLIQTMGRAARHIEGKVLLYADKMTDSMREAIQETERRRKVQEEYNKKHGITPRAIEKSVRDSIRAAPTPESGSGDSGKGEERTLFPAGMPDMALVESEIKELEAKMKDAVNKLDFETAAEARDKIRRLKFVRLGRLGV